MASRKRNSIHMEGVEILPRPYRNFEGRPTDFNRNGGVRDFAVVLPEDLARQLSDDGFNVKHTKDYERDGEIEPGVPFLKVKVRFDVLAPIVVLVTSRNEQDLEEGMVDMLDTADIVHADLVVNPRDYVNNDGEPCISVFLKSGYFTIEEDYFAEKYARRREEREARENKEK